jgi:hypothetical protein
MRTGNRKLLKCVMFTIILYLQSQEPEQRIALRSASNPAMGRPSDHGLVPSLDFLAGFLEQSVS